MSEPYDPFDSPWVGGDALITGKQLYETLTEQPHFINAERVVKRLTERDLAMLAF